MTLFWDGLKSLGAAMAVLFLCGVPALLAGIALSSVEMALWLQVAGWAAVAGLALVGAILTVAFTRKGLRGISPSRSRRR